MEMLYGANYGPVPFAIGKLPQQEYIVVKVFSRVQYNTQPANPQEVQAGDVPSFPSTSALVKGKMVFPMNPEAIQQFQVASQLEANGKIEEAIQYYRKALDADSNNPIALNTLDWILATTDKLELRNGEEAVQFATRAAEQTDWRQPLFIGTLAAAYAQAGQFPQACDMALTAHALAWITGQKEIAAKNQKLLDLYSSGKTVDATDAP
jgi:tetratricopeptide (TPR) repeat protein